MELFNVEPSLNLLPCDGNVNYYGKILMADEAEYYFDRMFENIEWKNDEAIIFGNRILTKRKAAWYGDKAFTYTYSKSTKIALPWTNELSELKRLVEARTGATFNSCLLNLYHNGDEGVSWHSDDETALAKNAAIALLSLGAERKFSFKHKRIQESTSLLLEKGSLLVMKGATQTNWCHCLPKSKKIVKPRISLTFRKMVA